MQSLLSENEIIRVQGPCVIIEVIDLENFMRERR